MEKKIGKMENTYFLFLIVESDLMNLFPFSADFFVFVCFLDFPDNSSWLFLGFYDKLLR